MKRSVRNTTHTDRHRKKWEDREEDLDRRVLDLVRRASARTGSIVQPSTQKSSLGKSSAMEASRLVDLKISLNPSSASAELRSWWWTWPLHKLLGEWTKTSMSMSLTHASNAEEPDANRARSPANANIATEQEWKQSQRARLWCVRRADIARERGCTLSTRASNVMEKVKQFSENEWRCLCRLALKTVRQFAWTLETRRYSSHSKWKRVATSSETAQTSTRTPKFRCRKLCSEERSESRASTKIKPFKSWEERHLIIRSPSKERA